MGSDPDIRTRIIQQANTDFQDTLIFSAYYSPPLLNALDYTLSFTYYQHVISNLIQPYNPESHEPTPESRLFLIFLSDTGKYIRLILIPAFVK